MRVASLLGAAALGSLLVSAATARPLVDADWLAANLGREDLVVLDIRNEFGGGSRESFLAGHIPGAVHSDYLKDGWRTTVDDIPGMTPRTDTLEALIGSLGIGNDHEVVIVHGGANPSDFGGAARVYWTFRYLGHDAVAILDGGFGAWQADPARPIAQGEPRVEPELFLAEIRPELMVDTAAIRAAIAAGGAALVDARPAEQWQGKAKHAAARAHGRLPGAVHAPHDGFFVPGTGKLKPVAELEAALPAALDAASGTIVTYCNTGHWAATDWFVLSELLGRADVRLYDASMVGWTQDPANPVASDRTTLDAFLDWARSLLPTAS
jgi:thiosulfate/3-mercaptopyruvate sulfurtransferase